MREKKSENGGGRGKKKREIRWATHPCGPPPFEPSRSRAPPFRPKLFGPQLFPGLGPRPPKLRGPIPPGPFGPPPFELEALRASSFVLGLWPLRSSIFIMLLICSFFVHFYCFYFLSFFFLISLFFKLGRQLGRGGGGRVLHPKLVSSLGGGGGVTPSPLLPKPQTSLGFGEGWRGLLPPHT